MTPAELAAQLGIDAKALRRWLRATWPPEAPHSRWVLEPKQVKAAYDRFGMALPGEWRRPLPVAAASPPQPPAGRSSDAGWSEWTPLVTSLNLAPRTPGVYMARRSGGGPVVYVGMAGERRGQGIRGRLAFYLSGKGLASGLGEAVFDRAVADEAWLTTRLEEVKRGEPRRAKLWGQAAVAWANLEVCWQSADDRAAALALELEVMRSLPQEPLWNRHR